MWLHGIIWRPQIQGDSDGTTGAHPSGHRKGNQVFVSKALQPQRPDRTQCWSEVTLQGLELADAKGAPPRGPGKTTVREGVKVTGMSASGDPEGQSRKQGHEAYGSVGDTPECAVP